MPTPYIKSFVKGPGDVLDYPMSWTSWLATGETISTSTWTVTDGLTEDSNTHASGVATVWLSGGTDGETYYATNQIVTSAGRTVSRTIQIVVAQR